VKKEERLERENLLEVERALREPLAQTRQDTAKARDEAGIVIVSPCTALTTAFEIHLGALRLAFPGSR
jgi:hypothetical protein